MSAARRALATLLVALFVFSTAPNAIASIHEVPQPLGTSETNPGALDDYEVAWRGSWGKSLFPQFSLNVPTNAAEQGEGPIYSVAYFVTQTPESVISTTSWNGYYRDMVDPNIWNVTLNWKSIIDNPPPLVGAWVRHPDAATPYEGPFYLHFRYLSLYEPSKSEIPVFIGVDTTPPLRVTGVAARPQVGQPSATGVLPSNRIHVTWDDKRYDALSGTGYFQILVDGAAFAPAGEKTPLRIYDSQEQCAGLGRPTYNTPRSATIELQKSGKHTLQVRAIDRATNVGASSTPLTVITDPDEPTITLTAPSQTNQVVGKEFRFTATAKDQGGVKYVRFFIDGQLKYTDTTAPYGLTWDMTGYAQGSTHSVTAQVTDLYGRTASDSGSFKVDKVAPRLTSVSDTPDPFYPRRQDGYKDNSRISFYLSERANVKLVVYTSTGKTWRTITKTFEKGVNSFYWNGRSDSGAYANGTYKYGLIATDAAKNSSSWVYGYTHTKDYELVRLSSGAVKVIPR